MFHKKISVKDSKTHGLGLFTDENIEKDSLIYSFTPKLDIYLTKEEYNNLHQEEQKFISHYGCFDKRINKWRVEHDNIRFCNHSSNPNIEGRDGKIYSIKEIKAGEELLEDYSHFEDLREEIKKV